MNKIYHTAIIGGGAAGLMTAVELTRGDFSVCGKDIVIIEKNDRVGKKLLATGNGQGNLTNSYMGCDCYYGDRSFIESFVKKTNKTDLCAYFEELGIPLTKKEGKVYPLSKQASSVLDIIRAYLFSVGVQESTSSLVKSIEWNGKTFEIKAERETFFAKKVVLAVGGAVAKQFGTDGSSYSLAQSFGHKKTEIYPSLVQLKTDTDKIRGLKGLKEVAKVTALKDGKVLKSAVGDLLFTEFGVSGSAVFSVSAAVTNEKGVKLLIEFVPDLRKEQLVKILENRKTFKYIDKENFLNGIVNKRVGQAVLKTANGLSAEDVAFALKNFTLSVTGNLGFNYAQVTKGGIVTKDIDENTFESKLQSGLYLVGEVLDVDGDCGGYNLTFAFLSAILAAKDIKNKLNA